MDIIFHEKVLIFSEVIESGFLVLFHLLKQENSSIMSLFCLSIATRIVMRTTLSECAAPGALLYSR